MVRALATITSALTLLTSTPGASAAQPQSFEAEYSVSLFGLTIGRARFASSFGPDGFSIDGSLSSAGVARIIDRTRGTTSVRGAIGRDGVAPRSYVVEYSSGRKNHRTTISFTGDRITNATNEPPPGRRGKGWIPVSASHLSSVVDPISSTIVHAKDPSEVCGRTLKIFDGEMRVDLQLKAAGSPSGVAPEAVTCSVRFVPVAGYQMGREQVEFLASRSRISISFLPLGETGFYTPVDARIGTQIGTVHVRAERIEAR